VKEPGFNPRNSYVKMFEKKPVPKIGTLFLMENTAVDSKLKKNFKKQGGL